MREKCVGSLKTCIHPKHLAIQTTVTQNIVPLLLYISCKVLETLNIFFQNVEVREQCSFVTYYRR